MQINNNEIKIYYKTKRGIWVAMDKNIKYILKKLGCEFIGSGIELGTNARELLFKKK